MTDLPLSIRKQSMREFAIAAMALLLALVAPVVAAPDNFTQEAWQLTHPSYGCKSDSDYLRLMQFIIIGDDTAALKFVMPKMRDGSCDILEPGKVFLEKNKVFGNPCVRKRGDPDCYFTRRLNLEPVK
jgi:hypothetical protein